MILINLKIRIKPDQRDDWLGNIRRYASAVNAEAGALSFDVYEHIDAPNQFAVIEGFASKEAGESHVQTQHFKEFLTWFPSVIDGAPQILNTEITDGGWTTMAEFE